MSMHKMSSTAHVSAALALLSGTSKAMYLSTSLPVKVPLEKEARVALKIVTRILASNVVHISSELSGFGTWTVYRQFVHSRRPREISLFIMLNKGQKRGMGASAGTCGCVASVLTAIVQYRGYVLVALLIEVLEEQLERASCGMHADSC